MGTGVVHQVSKTAIFIATAMEKHLAAVHFIKGCFCQFVTFLTEKVWV